MQSDISDKNSKIAQLNIVNVELFTQNNYLTELRAKDKLSKNKKETGSEEEDAGSKRQKGKRVAEEYKGQRKRQKYYEQERRQKIKCQWHEKGR